MKTCLSAGIVLNFCFTLSYAQITTVPRAQPKTLSLSHISNCCGVADSPTALMTCASLASSQHRQQVTDTFYSSGGPSLGVGIVTYATRDIWNYSAYSFAVNQAYAEHNGYTFLHLDESSANYEPRDARWNKIKILEDALDPNTGWGRDLQYLMWVDADLIVLDMGLRLERVAADHPEADILISAENAGSSTLVNSGSILVKNTLFARRFLHKWWTHADRRLYSDQEQFDMLYKAESDSVDNALDRDNTINNNTINTTNNVNTKQTDKSESESRSSSSSNEKDKGYDKEKEMKRGSVEKERERGVEVEVGVGVEVMRKIVILSPDALNSDPPAMTQIQPHNQVVSLFVCLFVCLLLCACDVCVCGVCDCRCRGDGLFQCTQQFSCLC